MKALIITYYWPPAGGSGVQRWLKFVKYLRDFGIEPVIYTVENPNYPITDESLQKDISQNIEILRQPIWEPHQLFGKQSQQTSAGFLDPNPGFLGRLMQYIRANYFIPDARKFWIKPSVNYLSSYLKDHPVDVVISTGPPHSTHVIGLKLKEKHKCKWIADFRDPWTEIDYFHQLPLTKRSKKIHTELERNVVQKADAVLVVGKTMAESYQKHSNKVYVLTNGFDDELSSDVNALDEQFSLVHIGLMNADRNHKILWQTLEELCAEHEGFSDNLQLKFIGKLANEVYEDLAHYHLKSYCEFVAYMPHKEVANHQKKAQVLLLPINNVPSAKGIITGKIFEYVQAKRPILAIAPTDGDLAEILRKTNAGVVVDFSDMKKLKQELLRLYNSYKSNTLMIHSKNIEQYHRKSLTEELSKIIKSLA